MADLIIIFLAKYLFIFILATSFIIFWKLKKGERKKLLILSIISLPLIYLLLILAGHFYYDPRPFVAGHFTPLIPHDPDNGFPSDHTLLISSVAMIFWYFSRKASIIFWISAALIGVARVLSGVHQWVDILGSMIIAIITITTVHKYVFPKINH